MKLTESQLRSIVKTELKKMIKEGDVVDFGTFRQMQMDREEEKIGQQRAEERIAEIREEILNTFASAVNALKTRIYDKEDPQWFDEASMSIGPKDLYLKYRDSVLPGSEEDENF